MFAKVMKGIVQYLSPINRLGKRKYSFFFPLFSILFTFIFIEAFVQIILKNPDAVGLLAIFIPIALIIYFAFRDGLKGGFTAVVLTISYYFYIIYSREHSGEQLITSLETTGVLGLLYFLLAGIIGWLKQTIDKLIELEADERRRFQAIVQQLPVGVIITDKDGAIGFVNRRANNILGMKIPIGFNVMKGVFVKVVESKNFPTSQSLLGRALKSGKTIISEELTIETESGRKVYIEASASAIRNKHGRIIAAAEIVSDVTAQKEHEKRKDDFVNMASHELKTPITSMKLYLDALARNSKKYDREQINKMVTSVRNQTERLQKLVSDLLDVSRLQTGKLSFQKDKFDLAKLVEDAVIELRAFAPEKKITFSGKIAGKVLADQFRIYQVITNLLTNAIKYSGDTRDINVRVKKEKKRVVVSVQDFGFGIAKDQQKKIFDRLYQVMDDREKTFPGLGMGLYISREIVRRHKGQIWVESEKGKGSTFFFNLPMSG